MENKNNDCKRSRRLTHKQKAFVEKYLINGGNATKAAIEAGYSKKTSRAIGNENLTKPNIIDAIEAELFKKEKRNKINRDMVINELANVALARFDDIVSWDSGRMELRSLDSMNSRGRAAIKSIKYKEIPTENGIEREFEVTMWDKKSALIELIKHTVIPFHIRERIDAITEKDSLDVFQQMKLYEDLGYQIPRSLELKARYLAKNSEEEDFDFLGDLDNEEFERELIAKKKAENLAEREAELEIRKKELAELDRKEEESGA